MAEEFLRDHIHRLEVRLDAFAIDAAEALERNNPTLARDLIFSMAVDGRQEPLVVNGPEGDNHVYVIWSIEAVLSMSSPFFFLFFPLTLFLS